MEQLKGGFRFIKEVYEEWSYSKGPRLAAALAFYTVGSLAPILIFAVAIAGFAFGEEAARGELLTQIQGLIGKPGAEVIQGVLSRAHRPETSLIAAILGVIVLLISAGGVFAELQDSMNTIWKVDPKKYTGLWEFLKNRLFSILMVLAVGFLLLTSLVISAVLGILGNFIVGISDQFRILLEVANNLVAMGVVILIFGAIYKYLPRQEVSWRAVWPAAVFTAVLFTIGKFLIGLYLGSSAIASIYGAAGSFVVMVFWVYYSAQILFFGAELTRVITLRRQGAVRSASLQPTSV